MNDTSNAWIRAGIAAAFAALAVGMVVWLLEGGKAVYNDTSADDINRGLLVLLALLGGVLAAMFGLGLARHDARWPSVIGVILGIFGIGAMLVAPVIAFGLGYGGTPGGHHIGVITGPDSCHDDFVAVTLGRDEQGATTFFLRPLVDQPIVPLRAHLGSQGWAPAESYERLPVNGTRFPLGPSMYASGPPLLFSIDYVRNDGKELLDTLTCDWRSVEANP